MEMGGLLHYIEMHMQCKKDAKMKEMRRILGRKWAIDAGAKGGARSPERGGGISNIEHGRSNIELRTLNSTLLTPHSLHPAPRSQLPATPGAGLKLPSIHLSVTKL
jgi:hypothetical protein